MYEKGPRQFYDDTCVVPEKFDGRFLFNHVSDLYFWGRVYVAFPEKKKINILDACTHLLLAFDFTKGFSFHCFSQHIQLVAGDILKADALINKAEQST